MGMLAQDILIRLDVYVYKESLILRLRYKKKWFLNMVSLIPMKIALYGITSNNIYKILLYYVNYYLLMNKLILFQMRLDVFKVV